MRTEELQRVLLADLGKSYNPQEALNFLKSLEENNIGKKEAKNLETLLENPPNEDITLHIIYKTPYVLGEIVIAGKKTRKEHPLCSFHPIHFKKTYLQKMSRWETDTHHEAKQTHKVWQHFEETSQETTQGVGKKPKVPLPLASNATTFRSQLLTAKSLGALSPIRHTGSPENTLKQILEASKNYGPTLELWQGLESLDQTINQLHNGGFLHNDLHKENLMLYHDQALGEMQGALIDFETTEEDQRFGTQLWSNACREDKKDLIKEAALIYLACDTKTKNQIRKTNSFLIKEALNKIKSDPTMIYLENFLNKRKIKDIEIT